MKRKVSFGLLAAALALVTTSCFTMQAFSLFDSSLAPGKGTKAQFVLRPMDADGGSTTPNKVYQFVMIGVDSTDLAIGKAVWGTNGTFGGPVPMVASSPLPALLTSGACSFTALGSDLSGASGVTWKGFVTINTVADKNLVDSTTTAQVGVKVKASATVETSHEVIGVTGGWQDDTGGASPGIPDAGDAFWCTGIADASLYVK